MKLFNLILLIIVCKISFCQNTYKYIGSLILENKQIISYTVNIKEENGTITGFSLTNIGLQDETKTEIAGLYFKSEKEFQLNETKIIYTNSKIDLENFCYVNMNLKLKGINKKRLEGSFTGYFINGKECANGKVILIEEEKAKKISENILKKIEKNKQKDKIKKENIVEIKKLQNQDTIKIDVNSDAIKINVWDADQEDGDRINLILNNITILNNFLTKKIKKEIQLDLLKGKNILNLYAINEGESPPNTSKIEIIDKKIVYPLIIQLKKYDAVTIELINNTY